MVFNRLRRYFFNKKRSTKEKMMKGELYSPIIPPLKGHAFFDRMREEQGLKHLLTSEPRLSLVIGPPSSGKTTLLLNLLEKLSYTRPVIHINLRSLSFSSPAEFYSALDAKLSPLSSKIKRP